MRCKTSITHTNSQPMIKISYDPGPGFTRSSISNQTCWMACPAKLILHCRHPTSQSNVLDHLTNKIHSLSLGVLRLHDALGATSPIVLGQALGKGSSRRRVLRERAHARPCRSQASRAREAKREQEWGS